MPALRWIVDNLVTATNYRVSLEGRHGHAGWHRRTVKDTGEGMLDPGWRKIGAIPG